LKNRYLPDTQTPAPFPGAYEPGLEAVHPRFGHFFGLLAVVGLIAFLCHLARAAWDIAGPAFGRIGHAVCRIYFRTPFGLLGLGCWIVAYGTPDQPVALIMAAAGSLLLRRPLLRYTDMRARYAARVGRLKRRAETSERSAHRASNSAQWLATTGLRARIGFRTLDPAADIDRLRRDARRHWRRYKQAHRRIEGLRRNAPDPWSIFAG
jgi:hypothetical protein